MGSPPTLYLHFSPKVSVDYMLTFPVNTTRWVYLDFSQKIGILFSTNLTCIIRYSVLHSSRLRLLF